ncbi:MAG TPA: hypothetical protein VIP30_03040 [Stenotrophomonas sp.]
MEYRKLYPSTPLSYDCPVERRAVALISLWFLETEQGADGRLSPMCSKVICSFAAQCGSLVLGRCPLTVGHGEVMNKMSVHVMQGQPEYWLTEVKGEIAASGEARPEGLCIWYGRTYVLESAIGAQA